MERHFVIRHVRLFDGMRLLDHDMVIVQDGIITAIGTDLPVPAATQIIDGTGQTLLPGLIDAHTHVITPTRASLRQALVFGVTTELDMFMDVHEAQTIKAEQVQGGGWDMADLRSAGTLATAPGGHGTEFGLPIPTIRQPEEAQAFIDARLAEGSDYIKLIYDDYQAFGRAIPTLSKETLAALVQAAHRRHALVLVHIMTLQGARETIDAGVDGLAHLFVDAPPDQDFGHFVAAHRAFVIPTLTVLERICGTPGGDCLLTDPHLAPYLAETDAANLRRVASWTGQARLTYAAAEEAVRQLAAAQVPLLAGTDAPNPGTIHGASVHREVELLVQAGLSPIGALSAATSVPARVFGLTDRGQIAPGYRADLVLVQGDPTRQIRATRAITGVWKDGYAVNRQRYQAEQARQQQSSVPSGLPVSSGLISDFEDGTLHTFIGAGWQVSLDTVRGGSSTAELLVIPDGVPGERKSLLIRGVIGQGAFPWAGGLFFPGPTPWAPADLSSLSALTFWTKGDGQQYRILFFAGTRQTPLQTVTFSASQVWQQVVIPLRQVENLNRQAVLGVLFTGGPETGAFSFQLDTVGFR